MDSSNINNFNMDQIHSLMNLLNSVKVEKERTKKTLESFCTEYENYIEGECSQKYYKSVKLSMNALRKYFSDDIDINELTVKMIEDFIINLKINAPKGYRVYYRNLKAAFNKALDWDYISSNPFVKIKLRKQQEEHPQTIDASELSLIMNSIKQQQIKDIVFTSFYTGCRLSEIINLRWNNIDLVNNIITVGDEMFSTKSRKQRQIPICEKLSEKLQGIDPASNGEIVNLNSYVFGKSRTIAFNADYVSRQFKKASRAVGLEEKVKFHSLRHSFASNLVKAGVDLYIVKELLGHSSITVTERYSHLKIETLIKNIEVLNNAA
ncbi:MAG: tyrosine-type recombinase/integrase [Melioribacteraceae bacterium]|nr:tyrosine-type recombinase/integrase [Melioribacteraceae bacterium]